MKNRFLFCVAIVGLMLGTMPAQAAFNVTGNPATDAGWAFAGNSLENGVYVTGSGNYGYDAYGTALTIAAGSNLEISDGSMSWLTGDTVLGVGGVFHTVDAVTNGWTAYTGGAVNGLLPTTSPYVGPKFQAKFGTSAATWTTSTSAPSSGNGNSSSGNGGGRIQVRTSGYFQTGTHNSGQTEPWTWDGNSGQLLVLDKDNHILWDGDTNLDKRVARMIWNWDDTLKQVVSWELLLNVSLLDRLYPDFSGLLPAIGDAAIMTVQPGDSGNYTDALVHATQAQAVPEASSIVVWGFLTIVIGGAAWVRRQQLSVA